MTENISERIDKAIEDIEIIQMLFLQEYGEECLPDKEIYEVLKIAKAEHEELKRYHSIGTVEECQKAVEKQKKVCEPEYLGENRAIGCRSGRCICGNIVRSYEDFCSDCGSRLEWGNVWG